MGFKNQFFFNGIPKSDCYYLFLKRWQNELKVMKNDSFEDTHVKTATPNVIDG